MLTFILFFETLSLSAKSMDIERYHRHSSIQWSWAISSLYDLSFSGDETILDLGSADGKITAFLASKVPQGSVIGLDPCGEAIDFAQTHYSSSSFPNLKFINSDATVFSSPETYELITAFCTLNWIDQKEDVFSKIEQNLKVGGKALIVVPCDLPGTEHLYENWVKNAGLEIVYSKKERTNVIFHNSEELKQWLCSIMSNLSDEEFDSFFQKHLQKVNELFPQAGDGRVYVFPFKLTLLLRKTEN
jgi:trans-aconitate methyltransferase